jgi:formylglycine-generating enzyme required for sulfatase activity
MRRLPRCTARLALCAVLALATGAHGATLRCAADAVKVGVTCVDRYEASVWRIPATNASLIARVQKGTASRAELVAGGATQVGALPPSGCSGDEYGPGFPPNGAWTEPLYAASVKDVLPSTCITWFQAEQACRHAGKRLATNQEWQAAAIGTPDPGAVDDGSTTCATATPAGVATGSRAACVSRWKAHDMIGNAWEWTADWGTLAGGCTSWPAGYDGDTSCSGRSSLTPATSYLPSAYVRGGDGRRGADGGVYAFEATREPSTIADTVGFRCAR